jgi:hypothetical protein
MVPLDTKALHSEIYPLELTVTYQRQITANQLVYARHRALGRKPTEAARLANYKCPSTMSAYLEGREPIQALIRELAAKDPWTGT